MSGKDRTQRQFADSPACQSCYFTGTSRERRSSASQRWQRSARRSACRPRLRCSCGGSRQPGTWGPRLGSRVARMPRSTTFFVLASGSTFPEDKDARRSPAGARFQGRRGSSRGRTAPPLGGRSGGADLAPGVPTHIGGHWLWEGQTDPRTRRQHRSVVASRDLTDQQTSSARFARPPAGFGRRRRHQPTAGCDRARGVRAGRRETGSCVGLDARPTAGASSLSPAG